MARKQKTVPRHWEVALPWRGRVTVLGVRQKAASVTLVAHIPLGRFPQRSSPISSSRSWY